MRKKYIIVTGWVISGIGKWVTSACTGFFFAEKHKVTPIKLDWYLNIDPWTMNPHEHGEVFVLDDGSEVDMDFGHYERFLGNSCEWIQSISMGKIFAGILEKERRGDFLGKTVQMIPHVTDYIVNRIEETFQQTRGDICMIEVGGTVGDIEAELYFEAIRQMRQRKKREDFLHIHLTYVPVPGGVQEQKTKPTQQSVNLLQSRWLFPDIIVARSSNILEEESRRKIALFSNLRKERVFSIPDVSCIYTIPSLLKKQKIDRVVHGLLNIPFQETKKLDIWKKILKTTLKKKVRIGLIWKYTALEDSYSSIVEALNHVWYALGVDIDVSFINTRKKDGIEGVKKCDGCIVPGGFWDTAIENMLETLVYIRENKIPCLWICLWLQLMVIEFTRNILGNTKANSLEFKKNKAENNVITLLDSQKHVVEKWGTMRLWKQNSIIEKSLIQDLYNNAQRVQKGNTISERFRHRYEVHPSVAKSFKNTDLQVVWKSEKEWIVQFIEMKINIHPYYVWTQAHPELTSKLENPAPLFMGLIKACMK